MESNGTNFVAHSTILPGGGDGFNDGAFFTNFLARNRAQKIRAIVPIAGGGDVPMPALVVHGKDDPTVDQENGVGTATAWAEFLRSINRETEGDHAVRALRSFESGPKPRY